MTFTTEELTAIARTLYNGESEEFERDGLRFTFTIEDDDRGTVDHVNDADCYGKLAWPRRNSYNDRDSRPDGFTGAARKFGPNQAHDAIWWEPYRDEDGKVYNATDDIRFMEDLLIYGFVGLVVAVHRQCECCDQWVEVGCESLWGIESPMVGDGNFEYLADIFSDLISEATPVKETA